MLTKIDIPFLMETTIKAGEAILKIYKTDFGVSYKTKDHSPLTEADLAANDVITKALEEHYPDIPLLSEEGKHTPYNIRRFWEYFWLIDPLDGTKEFINKSGDFTVNIALIHKTRPVLGIVYAPARDILYFAKKGEGAFKVESGGLAQRLPLMQPVKNKKTIVASKSHMSDENLKYISRIYPNSSSYDLVSIGSSLKICLVAEGFADMYPRLGPTMEWDTAAANAIALEAGKMVTIANENGNTNEPLLYNKEELLNPWFVVE